tara:strand:+ start:81 stop:503 length:423 start_codon:yes stop_codon:yes gene_type:complete
MAIPAKQIGISNEANLLWEISKQLDRINSVICTGPCPTTTTTTTLAPTILTYYVGEPVSMTYPAVSIYCDLPQVDYAYVPNYGPYTSIDDIVNALNTDAGTTAFGTFSNIGDGEIQLSVPYSVVISLCPSGTLSFSVQAD